MTYEEIELEFPEEFEMRERDKLAYRYPRYSEMNTVEQSGESEVGMGLQW